MPDLPRTGVTGGCKPTDVDAGNRTLAVSKSCVHSQLLNRLSGPHDISNVGLVALIISLCKQHHYPSPKFYSSCRMER